jgi:hypothetical protein
LLPIATISVLLYIVDNGKRERQREKRLWEWNICLSFKAFGYHLFFFYYIIVVLGVHCEIYKSFTKYRSWIHFLHHSPHSPFLKELKLILLFPFYTWVCNIVTTFSCLHPFLIIFLFPLVPAPPARAYSPFWKKRYVCLFKIVLQGVSLWHFHVYSITTRIVETDFSLKYYLQIILAKFLLNIKHKLFQLA